MYSQYEVWGRYYTVKCFQTFTALMVTVYLSPRFQNREFFHSSRALPVKLARRSFPCLHFIQGRDKKVVNSAKIIQVTYNPTSYPSATYLDNKVYNHCKLAKKPQQPYKWKKQN